MSVTSDLALENEILNCSNWILPRESREDQDAMKRILGVMYRNFIYSLTQKVLLQRCFENILNHRSQSFCKIKQKFDLLLETE